jgi:hypothetical protein
MGASVSHRPSPALCRRPGRGQAAAARAPSTAT